MCAKCGAPTVAPICDKCRRANTEASIEARRGEGLCPLCGKSPKKKDGRFCHNCGEAVASARNGNRGRAEWRDAFRYIVWRGYGVYAVKSHVDGDGQQMYVNLPLPANALDKLPKVGDRVINLDRYCPGYSGDAIRLFKRAVMRAHGLKREPSRAQG